MIEEVKRYRDAEYSNNDRTSRALSYVVEIIKNQPTAFDVDKVIWELNKELQATQAAKVFVRAGLKIGISDSFADGYNNGIEEAIKIVKKGWSQKNSK